MQKPYWTYIMEKNWKYRLSDNAKHSNIFCYGRQGSGRTEKVAVPTAETAISELRSYVIYAEHIQQYIPIRQQALALDYVIFDLEATEITDAENAPLAEQISNYILAGIPTLVLIADASLQRLDFHLPFVHTLLDLIYKEGTEMYPETYSAVHRDNATLFIMDGLSGNTVLQSFYLKPTFLQFCIIMDSEICSPFWRTRTISSMLQSRPHFYSDILPVDCTFAEEKTNDLLMKHFFWYIETVICTGVNGVRPQDHRTFFTEYILNDPSAKAGGRFIVEERPSAETLQSSHSPRHIQHLKIDKDNIESSTYSQIADDAVKADSWICEFLGHVRLFHDGYAYQPLVFPSASLGENWIESNLRFHPEFHFLRKEENSDIIQYVFEQDGLEEDFKLIRISKEDVENYKIDYFLRVLEMAELDDLANWMETDEAIAQGYDPSEDIRERMIRYLQAMSETDDTLPDEEICEPDIMDALPDIPPVDPYWKKYQQDKPEGPVVAEAHSLPESGVLFLGGHINMVKRIRRLHPKWMYITDDEFRSSGIIHAKYVFYWTNHSSHKMMENVFCRLTPDAQILYVKATNMELLEAEMLNLYRASKNNSQTDTEYLSPRRESNIKKGADNFGNKKSEAGCL